MQHASRPAAQARGTIYIYRASPDAALGLGACLSYGCLENNSQSELSVCRYRRAVLFELGELPEDGPASHPPEQRLGNLIILDEMHHPYLAGAGPT